jgi:hypothetical protein
MITAIAVCPNPPLLLPGATGQPVAEVEELRAACLAAVRTLLATAPPRVVIVGATQLQEEPAGALSIQVGRSLLAEVGALPRIELVEQVLTADLPPEECQLLGQEFAADPSSFAVLVMGDGSARRSEKAPGYFDERAEPFDAEVEAALRSGRPEELSALDPQLAIDLMAAGRPAWQVMAAMVQAGTPGPPWRVEAHYFGAPFGVFYAVVNWLPS